MKPFFIDYVPGTHGNFLEYVVNTRIFNMDKFDQDIFDEKGRAHIPQQIRSYADIRPVVARHFYEKKYEEIPNAENFIRITHEFDQDHDLRYIWLVNCWYKVPDEPFEQIFDHSLSQEIRNSRVGMRKAYHGMITSGNFIDHRRPGPPMEIIFDFQYRWFFDWAGFCQGLESLAQRIGRAFKPMPDLFDLWQHFIDINEGYNSFKRCRKILDDLNKGVDGQISVESYEEAWLIDNLIRLTGDIRIIYALMDQASFPATTAEIRDICSKNSINLNLL